MKTADDHRREKLFALMRRYNQLGRMLPDPKYFEYEDINALTSAKVVLNEMKKVQAEIDAMKEKVS